MTNHTLIFLIITIVALAYTTGCLLVHGYYKICEHYEPKMIGPLVSVYDYPEAIPLYPSGRQTLEMLDKRNDG